MRHLIWIVLACFSGSSVFAEPAPVTASSPEQEIERAFQREYAYLAAQREALQRQRQKVESRTSADLAAAKRGVQELGAKLARLQAENEGLFSNVQDAERIKREERNREDQLAVAWRKARKAVEETRHSLQFEGGKTEVELLLPEKLAISDLSGIGAEAIGLVESASRLVRFKGTFLDQDDRLVESTLFRLGRVAVFAETSAGVKLLGPDGKGALKVVESDKNEAARGLIENKPAGNVPVYLFESLQDRLTVKKPAGLADRLADLVPLLFLGMLFLMVAFLFGQLARA